MMEAAALLAGLYVLAYVAAVHRLPQARVVVLCPLQSERVPEEIVERLGEPRRVEDPEPSASGSFVVRYLPDAPGIVLAAAVDEASFDRQIAPYLNRPALLFGRDQLVEKYLRDRRWNAPGPVRWWSIFDRRRRRSPVATASQGSIPISTAACSPSKSSAGCAEPPATGGRPSC